MRNKLFETTLVGLLRSEPFFSSFYRYFRRQESTSVSTAGVSVDNGMVVLYYNPEYFQSLKPIERIGLLKHEAYHIIFKHCTARKREPHLIWNYATDLAINSLIPENELPEGALMPGMPVPEGIANLSDSSAQHAFTQIHKLIYFLNKGESSEWYFEKLMELQGEFEHIQNSFGTDGFQEALVDCDIPSVLDEHGEWFKGMSSEQKNKIDQSINNILEGAVRHADSKGWGWGTIGLATQERLRNMVAKTINWKEILSYFIGTTQRGNKRRTHRRINRKYPYIHPGIRRAYTSSIAIYIDQSGSVGNDDIEMFFAALSELSKETEFVVFHFDTEVDETSRTRWKRHQQYNAHRTRFGGTCFRSVTKHFETVQNEFDGYIIMTDGYAPKPPRAIKKRCWMICPNGEIPAWVSIEDTAIKMSL